MNIHKVTQKIHFMPVLMLFSVVALGLHAGQATRTLMLGNSAQAQSLQIKSAVKQKNSTLQSRSEITLSDEIASKKTLQNNTTDEKTRQLELRERLADATEKRIDGKITALRLQQNQQGQQALIKKQQTDQQFASIVKLYEAMKPKDAAKIFEKLDMSVQLAVSTRMREQKMAAVMAEMNPDAARTLTMQMAMLARTNTIAH